VDWRNTDPVVPRERLVHIATTGVMIPEAIEAADILRKQRVAANVLNMTSPRHLFEAWQAMQQFHGHAQSGRTPFDWLIPTNERHAPIVTVHDGASHALSWLGSVYGELVIPLGVDEFGQSGDSAELYRHFGIDAEGIATAALAALSRCGISV
jgi:pyruvate dehydrogenase E1 component